MAHYVTLRLRNLAEKVMQSTVSSAWLFYKEVCSMAGWEEELAVLLRELGVTQEKPRTHLRPAPINEADSSQGKPPLQPRNKVKRQTQSALFWEGAGAGRDDSLDSDAWMGDLSLMRREVDSIVTQVIHLMQHGDLDPALKEDVLVVLRALRRRASVTQQAAASDTAYLEAAAAMLHFCRLVLRLSEVATEDL
jgi:hypothetical protein